MSSRVQSHLQDYFDRFGNFRYDSSQPTMSQFQSLSQQTGWTNDVYKQEKKALQTALVLQFNDIYGESESDMDNWEELCNAMDVDPMPRTVKQCKRLFRRTHVNLVDLVDTKGTGRRVPTYETVGELADYTKKTGKFFPREHAKAGGLLKFLLRPILASGKDQEEYNGEDEDYDDDDDDDDDDDYDDDGDNDYGMDDEKDYDNDNDDGYNNDDNNGYGYRNHGNSYNNRHY